MGSALSERNKSVASTLVKMTLNLGLTLKQRFGYSDFRPLQEAIIQDALAGRDVFALMPTGGGKSLCFQLPALMREGLTIARTSSRRVPVALCRARTLDARYVFGARAELEHRANRHRRGTLHQRM